jgi:DNA-binding NtrC family response regulator
MKSTTVLCVDDDPRILHALKSALNRRYNVVCAGSGAQALELLAKQSVQIILLDQRMPEMSGLELLRQARTVAPNAIRVLLTGYSDLNAVVSSINEGEVFRLLSKPWSNEVLLATLARAEALANSLAQTGLAAGSTEILETVALLRCVVTPDTPALAESAVAASYTCYSANTPDAILTELEARPEIGMLLVEFSQQNELDERWIQFLGQLKRARPALVTLVLSASLDFNLLTRLINQVQVFRYLSAPCSPERLKAALASAVEQHRWLHQHPDARYLSEDSQELPVVVAPTPTALTPGPTPRTEGGVMAWLRHRLQRGRTSN